MSSSEADSDSGSSAMTSMVIACSSALVIFGVIYYIFDRRAKEKHDGWGSSSNPSTTTAHSAEDASTTPAPQQQQQARPPPPKFTQKLEPKVRQPGDPIYDRLLIGGTTSLGFLMWIGATIVLIMSLVGHADYKNATTSDFTSLGPQGCRVENSTRYTYRDKKLDALNKVCVEEWEYQVHVVSQEHSFVSSIISLESCRDDCDLCLRQNWLFGPNYYPGSDPTKRGTYLGNNNDTTLVECWESTIPMEELSGFYDPYCHNQQKNDANNNNNQTCFVLYDTAVLLEQEKNSSQVGLYSAYACYAGGALLLLVVGFFMLRNKQVREAELGPHGNNNIEVDDDDDIEQQDQEQNTAAAAHQDQKDESSDQDITNNKDTQEEGEGVPDPENSQDASPQVATTVVEEVAFYKT